MGLKISKRIWIILSVALTLIVAGKLVLMRVVSEADDTGTPLVTNHVEGDPRSLDELIQLRFGDLEPFAVADECDAWVAENNWSFGHTLSYLNGRESRTINSEVDAAIQGFRREKIKQYASLTSDPETARPAVQLLLEVWAERVDEVSLASIERIKKLINEALAAGSKDALVRNLQLTYLPPENYSDAAETLSSLPEEITAAGYDSFFRLLAQHNRYRLASQHEAVNLGVIANDLIEDVVLYSDEYSADQSLTRITWYYIYAAFSRPLRDSEQDEMVRQLLISDKTDPTIAHFFVGDSLRRKASQMRGEGYASSVSEESWEEISRLARLACMHYSKAWLLRPDLPQAPWRLLDTISGLHPSASRWTPRQWFEITCRAQIDYRPAYSTYLRSLLPRWGGTYLDMHDFGKECAATKAYDTTIPFFLLNCIRTIASETPNSTTWETPTYVKSLVEFWDEVDTVRDQLINNGLKDLYEGQPPLRAAVMIRNAKYEQARKALEKTTWPPPIRLMQEVLPDPLLAASMAYAMAGPNVNELAAVEEKFGVDLGEDLTVEGLEKAIAVVVAAEKDKVSDRADRYFFVRKNSLQKQLDFVNNAWVQLTFDESLMDWNIRGGTASVENPATLLVSNVDTGPSVMFATPNVTFPPPFVVKAKLERIRGDHFIPRLGINVGPVSAASVLSKPGGLSFIFDDQPRAAGIISAPPPQSYYVHDLEDTGSMMIFVQQDRYTMFINDLRLPLKILPFRPNGQLSFGGNPYESAIGKFRLSDVQVHKVTPSGPEDEVGDEEGGDMLDGVPPGEAETETEK